MHKYVICLINTSAFFFFFNQKYFQLISTSHILKTVLSAHDWHAASCLQEQIQLCRDKLSLNICFQTHILRYFSGTASPPGCDSEVLCTAADTCWPGWKERATIWVRMCTWLISPQLCEASTICPVEPASARFKRSTWHFCVLEVWFLGLALILAALSFLFCPVVPQRDRILCTLRFKQKDDCGEAMNKRMPGQEKTFSSSIFENFVFKQNKKKYIYIKDQKQDQVASSAQRWSSVEHISMLQTTFFWSHMQ